MNESTWRGTSPLFSHFTNTEPKQKCQIQGISSQGASPGAHIMLMYLRDGVILLVALLHVYILVLEMFLWNTPRGRRAFGLTPEFAAQSKVLAANQGLYNGFLAAGLIWGLVLREQGHDITVFFLTCVLLAGVYGAVTANKRILIVQALPAALGLALVWLA